MGDPVEPEHGNSVDCDTQQLTTAGLAYWRCTTNLMSFAAYPDGLQHWAWKPEGLVAWTGPDPDSPVDAQLVSPVSADAGVPSAACLAPGDGPSTACQVADGANILGRLMSPGASNAYWVNVSAPGAELVASLTDLPADYDLYVADSAGDLVGQSVHEGTESEQVDLMLPEGNYYLYVHVDAAREPEPDNPYRLHVSVSPASAPVANLSSVAT